MTGEPLTKDKGKWKEKLFKIFTKYYGLSCTCHEGIEVEFFQASGHYQRCDYWKFCHAVNRSEQRTKEEFVSAVRLLREKIETARKRSPDAFQREAFGVTLKFISEVFVGVQSGCEKSQDGLEASKGTSDILSVPLTSQVPQKKKDEGVGT